MNRLNGSVSNSIVRLNTNGTLDPTFSAGTTITGTVVRVVTDANGKLLVVGNGISVNGGAFSTLVRLNADGTADGSFTLGALTQPLAGMTAAVQADGKILYSYLTTSADPSINTKLIRLNSDGSIDDSFTEFPRPVEALAILPNGQILAAGPFAFSYVSSQTGTEPHNGIVRLNSDGSHDRSFRSGLFVDQSRFSAVYAMRLMADGRILLGGRLFTASSTTPAGVARLNATGTIDGAFQMSGITAPFGVALVNAMHVAQDGSITAGGLFDSFGGAAHGNVARLTATGAVDPAFTASADDTVQTIAGEANGSIVLGGVFQNVNGSPRTAIARLVGVSTPQDHAPFDFRRRRED
jgi:uncharacterized delta-60 repeat protein